MDFKEITNLDSGKIVCQVCGEELSKTYVHRWTEQDEFGDTDTFEEEQELCDGCLEDSEIAAEEEGWQESWETVENENNDNV